MNLTETVQIINRLKFEADANYSIIRQVAVALEQKEQEKQKKQKDFFKAIDVINGLKINNTYNFNEEFRENQVNRIREGQCSPQAGILFSEMLTDFERIGDHTLNIANQYQQIGL